MAGEGPAADQGDGRPRPQTVLGVAGGGAVNELHGVGIRRDVETIRLGLDEEVGIGVGPAAMAVIVDAVAAVAAKEAVGQANIMHRERRAVEVDAMAAVAIRRKSGVLAQAIAAWRKLPGDIEPATAIDVGETL